MRIRPENVNEISRRLPDPLEVPTLTVEEAARVLGLSRAFTYASVKNGQIPSIRVGRRYLISTARLARMLGAGDAA